MNRAVSILLVAVSGIVGAVLGYYLAFALGWSKSAAWPPSRAAGSGALILAVGLSFAFLCVAAVIVVVAPGRKKGKGAPTTRATSAPAKIISVRPTGTWRDTPEGTQYKVVCELEVLEPDGSSYYARTSQFISEEFEEWLQEGRKVTVRRDPADPKRVKIVESRHQTNRSKGKSKNKR